MADKMDVDICEGQKGRSLGFWEAVDHGMTEKYNVGVFWHICVVRTSQDLVNDDVTFAWKILIRKQEALQMRIVSANPERDGALDFQFKPMDDPEAIDFEAVDVNSKGVWPDIMRQDHVKSKFDCINGPLWKFILGRIQKNYAEQDEVNRSKQPPYEYLFMLKIHHSICDGKSTFDLLYRQYLPILSSLVNGVDAENLIPFVPQSKSVEELFLIPEQLKTPVPWYKKLLHSGLFCRKPRTHISSGRPLYKFKDDVLPPEEDRGKEPSCVPKVFGKEICVSLMDAAKRHGVTVHCVLLQASAVALCRTAMTACVTLPGSFTQHWAIDIRKHLKNESPKPLAILNSNGISEHKRNTDFTFEEFWKVCKDLYPLVKSQCTKESCIKSLRPPTFFVDALKSTHLATNLTKMGVTPLLTLSNLGNTSADPEPTMSSDPMKIRLTEHFCGLTGIACLDLIPISQFMITYEKKITWNISHNPYRNSRRFVDAYLGHLEDILKTYCQRD